MKNLRKPKNLPVTVLAFSGIAFVLRWLLLHLAMDEKGLIRAWHPLELLLWLVAIAAVVLVLSTVWKLDGSSRYEDNFHPSRLGAAGAAAAAIGIFLTVLLQNSGTDLTSRARVLTGALACVCLAVTAKYRWDGKRPFFLLHTITCVFYALNMISCYRPWSSDPQLQHYVFTLFSSVGLMLFAYYQAAFDVDLGKRRMQLGVGLLTAFCCFTAASGTDDLLLYLTSGIWIITNLCSPEPVPAGE